LSGIACAPPTVDDERVRIQPSASEPRRAPGGVEAVSTEAIWRSSVIGT
jgi:hypothetical protein